MGVTATSGPGICLKSEAIGLAVMTEMPCLIIDVQRGGPSTGLPTKTEQADLLQAMFGRNGECPLPIVAPCSPSDCFNMTFEAIRIAISYMTPVILLSDGYLANGSEPWMIPNPSTLPKIVVNHPTAPNNHGKANSNGEPNGTATSIRATAISCRTSAMNAWCGNGPSPARPAWSTASAVWKRKTSPATSAMNRPTMSTWFIRAQKVANIANDIPELTVVGEPQGELLVIGWGGTHGTILSAVQRANARD